MPVDFKKPLRLRHLDGAAWEVSQTKVFTVFDACGGKWLTVGRDTPLGSLEVVFSERYGWVAKNNSGAFLKVENAPEVSIVDRKIHTQFGKHSLQLVYEDDVLKDVKVVG